MTDFTDKHPGAPRILFVGEIHSTHALSWIDHLRDESFNVRAFQTFPYSLPEPVTFPVYAPHQVYPFSALNLGPKGFERIGATYIRAMNVGRRLFRRVAFGNRYLDHQFLKVVQDWRPDIIHCFGLLAAGLFVTELIDQVKSFGSCKLVIQLRGGSDLALNHADKDLTPRLVAALLRADAILTDNLFNFELISKMGVSKKPWPGLERVPGTGGIDVDSSIFSELKRTSQRRLILWPKAYESPWSKGMPVLEALQIAWAHIQPCHIHMAMAVNELPPWISLLPEEMRKNITLYKHIPRVRIFELLRESRVMLAPSLIDGTPNAMWEAMAAGAVPIVSPLRTLTPLVRDNENVVMARNLYPEEIASALMKVMADDAMVDRIAISNREVVRHLAGRDAFHPKILSFYRGLVADGHS